MCDFEKELLKMKLIGFDPAKIPAIEAEIGFCGIFPARDDYAVAHKASCTVCQATTEDAPYGQCGRSGSKLPCRSFCILGIFPTEED